MLLSLIAQTSPSIFGRSPGDPLQKGRSLPRCRKPPCTLLCQWRRIPAPALEEPKIQRIRVHRPFVPLTALSSCGSPRRGAALHGRSCSFVIELLLKPLKATLASDTQIADVATHRSALNPRYQAPRAFCQLTKLRGLNPCTPPDFRPGATVNPAPPKPEAIQNHSENKVREGAVHRGLGLS